MQRISLRVRNEHRELLFDYTDECGRAEYTGDELRKMADRALNKDSGIERALDQALLLLADIAADIPSGFRKTPREKRILGFLRRTCMLKDQEVTEWARQLRALNSGS